MYLAKLNSQYTGVSTFASHTSPITDQSLQKSFHLSNPKEFQKFFPPLQKKVKHTTHRPDKKALDK